MNANDPGLNMLLRRLKPRHLHTLYLHWKGFTNKEIAQMVGYTEQNISNIINGPDAVAILDGLRSGAFDSMRSVDQELQMMAPALVSEKLNLALGSPDEKIRSTNCTELLQMAGHTPVRKIQRIEAHAENEEFGKMSEDEIRADLMKKAKRAPEKAPDGTILN